MRSVFFLLTSLVLTPSLLQAQPFTEAEATHLESTLDLQIQFPRNELLVGDQYFVRLGDGYAIWYETSQVPGSPGRREIQNARESRLFDVESSSDLPQWKNGIRILEFALLPYSAPQNPPVALALTGEHRLITLKRKSSTSGKHVSTDFLQSRGLSPTKLKKMRIESILTVNTDVYFVARNFPSSRATTGNSIAGTTMDLYRCPRDPNLACQRLGSIESFVKKVVQKHFRDKANTGIQSIHVREAIEPTNPILRNLKSPTAEIWIGGNSQVLLVPIAQILLYEALSIGFTEPDLGDFEMQTLAKNADKFIGDLNAVYRPFPPGTSKESMRKSVKDLVLKSALIVNKKDLLMPWLQSTAMDSCLNELSATGL